MSTGGFYEGGYSGYGGGTNNNTGSGGYSYGGGYSQSQPTAAPQQQQQQQQQYQQQQQQQTNPNSMDPTPMNFWNPTTASMAMSAANAFASGKGGTGDAQSQVMFGMAESMGKQFLETGWARAVPGLERSMVALRPYFAVDNGYVKRKMGRVLFPFMFKDWMRQVSFWLLYWFVVLTMDVMLVEKCIAVLRGEGENGAESAYVFGSNYYQSQCIG
jgi:hypothetical protein